MDCTTWELLEKHKKNGPTSCELLESFKFFTTLVLLDSNEGISISGMGESEDYRGEEKMNILTRERLTNGQLQLTRSFHKLKKRGNAMH